MFLLAVTMMVTMAFPAFASSVDVGINRFQVTKYTKYVSPQKKENTTSCYVKLDDLNTYNSAMVNVYGQASSAELGAQKILCNDGVNDRIISVGTGYLLRNRVKENGYGYATLGFSRAVTVNYDIAGRWSPDSVWESGLITI